MKFNGNFSYNRICITAFCSETKAFQLIGTFYKIHCHYLSINAVALQEHIGMPCLML